MPGYQNPRATTVSIQVGERWRLVKPATIQDPSEKGVVVEVTTVNDDTVGYCYPASPGRETRRGVLTASEFVQRFRKTDPSAINPRATDPRALEPGRAAGAEVRR